MRGVRGAMSLMIAIAGREGAGSAAVAALIVRGFLAEGVRPLLAVDAASGSLLHLPLGMERPTTLAALREEMLGADRVEAIGEDLFEALVQQRVREGTGSGEGLDLLALGTGGSTGSTSFLDNLLLRAMERLAHSYKTVVIDAGKEMGQLARASHTVIDHLVLVSGARPEELAGALSLIALADRLNLRVQRKWVLIDGAGKAKWPEGSVLPEGVSLLGEIPPDPELARREKRGRGLLDLPGDSPAAAEVEKAVRERLLDRTGIDTRRIID